MSHKPVKQPLSDQDIAHLGQCGDIRYSRIANDPTGYNWKISPIGINEEYTGSRINGHETGHVDMRKYIKPTELSFKIDQMEAAKTADIQRYNHDFDGGYRRRTPAEKLDRIKNRLYDLRWNSGIEVYPYEEGIEGLKTTLVCAINVMSEIVDYLEGK